MVPEMNFIFACQVAGPELFEMLKFTLQLLTRPPNNPTSSLVSSLEPQMVRPFRPLSLGLSLNYR